MSSLEKYSESVSLYSSTSLSLMEICERTGVSFPAFSQYLSRHHRDLILKRHNLEGFKAVRLRGTKGQTTAAYLKYHDAIAAADSIDYIEYNIAQIARIFGLDGTALGNQLRHHYPDIIPRRERERRRLGIADNIHHGVRPWCVEAYAEAVEMLRNTDMTVEEAAEQCGVAYKGLREHIACYHKNLVEAREEKREQAMKAEKVRGGRTGSWTVHEPDETVGRKYAEAVEMYRTSDMSVGDIALRLELNRSSLSSYIHMWYPELIVLRKGARHDARLSDTKRYSKSAAEKYAEAVGLLKNDANLSTNAVAVRFGFNPEVFREYLKEHEPELVRSRGMTRTRSGKVVGVKSSEKYSEALQIYATSTETLKSIAERLGLVYVSLGNYVRRNFPELIERHNSLLESMADRLLPE